jgi:nitrilase
MPQTARAALLQTRVRPSLEANLEAAAEMAAGAARAGAEILVLPEYFFRLPYDEPCARFATATEGPVRRFYERASAESGALLAGNVISRGRNLGVLYKDGDLLGTQPKLHPTLLERRWGIRPGRRLRRWRAGGATAGMLVCADILHPRTAMGLAGADLVLNPVVSRRRPRDDTGEARRAMYVARAFDLASFVLKAGSVAPGFWGRSLAAAPWGVVASVGDQDREEALVVGLDLERLRKIRRELEGLRG